MDTKRRIDALQKAIVTKIEAEQSLINANRELAGRMKKKIQTAISRIWNP